MGLLGADVYGYSIGPPTDPNLYTMLELENTVTSVTGDVADFESLSDFYRRTKPDFVFHLAAQPLVRAGYSDPQGTYRTNVMGTVNVMECVRRYGAQSILNVTTDKVYRNVEDWDHRYREGEVLEGYDPYSNSKSCSELVTWTYVRSFPDAMCPVSTARAGNVIGGGDFADDRIIPDCVKAAVSGKEVVLRNPRSVRPYQHVLEPLYAYLALVIGQSEDPELAGCYNVGPEVSDCTTNGELVDRFCKYWGRGLKWVSSDSKGPHEAEFLKLDNSKLHDNLGIRPIWGIDEAVRRTVEWVDSWNSGKDVGAVTDTQIREYLKGRGIDVRRQDRKAGTGRDPAGGVRVL